jgi:pyrroloquinoline quinone biosynthesis protein B
MPRLTALVLGSAAGGGFPQWNCLCPVCRLAWTGDPRVRPRLQASLAVSGDGDNWVLINASPDLPQQIRQHKVLHPHSGTRASPIGAVVLTGAEIDQIAGLLSLRERQPFKLYGTQATLDELADNPVFEVLSSEFVQRCPVSPEETLLLPGGVQARLFPTPGKAPLYRESGSGASCMEEALNVGVEINAGAARILYVPGAVAVTPALKERLAGADVLLFDGTLFRDDEMITTGTGSKTGRRMGHMPIDGEDGSLAALADIGGRRIYVHINNTNPILVEDSPQRAEVQSKGWEIAEDGMELAL